MPTYPVSYTTVEAMKATFPPIGSRTDMTSTALAYHAFQAEAHVNAYLSRQYSIPLSTRVPLVESVATDMAIFSALTTFISLKDTDTEHPFYLRFKRAKETLLSIANGAITLVGIDGSVVAGRGDIAEVYSNTMDYHPTFSELDPTLAILDTDKLDDLVDERQGTLWKW